MMYPAITTNESLPPLIRALLVDPACYDHPVKETELVETHISWVVLTGDYAYKIKKPVNLGFLDFSTLQLRQQDCIDELRLNRRLAADIYLGVVAINGTPNAPQVGGKGEILEYAVKMRQFPVDATLDHFSTRGELSEQHIDTLAACLVHFHLFECEQAKADSLWGEPETIARPVEENFQILAQDEFAQGTLLTELQSWCQTEHARLAPLMKDRKNLGRVRECHGDLHLANMAWVGGQLVIFDCLEFNPALRWIDVISEVAFCYMDLLHRQHDALASRFLNAWLEVTGDYQGIALLRYYAVYRALVRAKVASLRAGQVTEPAIQIARAEMTSCLQLAQRLACIPSPLSLSRNNLGHSPLVVLGMPLHSATGAFAPSLRGNTLAALRRPLSLYITHGLSGSGKTTLSQKLLQSQGLIRLRSDVERKRLAGLDALAKSRDGLYTRHFSRRTYEHLACLAETVLTSGWSVIVDAAFLERDQRDLFRDQAKRLGVRFQILDIQVDAGILRERVKRRQALGNDASEADLAVLEHQLANAHPLGADEPAIRC
ncbi:MAG: AAA family ATPase [Gallionella sp.]|jgi:hypothetical protein